MSFITNTPIIQSISDSSITTKIGITLQAHAAKLDDIAALSLTSGNFIVSNGSNFIVESGATARSSLGLGDIATLNASAFVKTDGTSIITSDLDMNSKKIINVAAPISNADAANKLYVDNIASGLDVKKSVVASTTLNITLSGTQTIDTVVLNIGDRVLVKNQTIQTENGIYDVASGAWPRSSDADNTPSNEVSGGMFTFIESGSQGGTGWILSNIVGNAILGTDNLIFTQFSNSSNILAGTNLTKTGNTIDLNSVLSNFASTGIDDTATSTQVTITDTDITFGGTVTMPNNANFNMKNFAGTAIEVMRLDTSDQLLIGGGASTTIIRTGSTDRIIINGGGVSFANGISVNSTTDSTSTITGSIQTDGGLGVAKDVFVGGDVILKAAILGSTIRFTPAVNTSLSTIRFDEVVGTQRASLDFLANSGDMFIKSGTIGWGGTIDLWTNGVTALKIDTSQNATFAGSMSINSTTDSTSTTTGSIHTLGGLGIRKDFHQGNPSSNTVIQHVFSNSPANFFVGLNSTAANRFVGSSSGYGFMGVTGATGIEIATNNTVALKINSSGNQTVRGGISFSGKSAIAANLLDDYEEGTWTPTVAGETTAGTYTLNLASFTPTYIKIGRLVHVDAELIFTTATGGVGNLIIGGLPFLYSNGRGVTGPLVHSNFNVAIGVSDVNIIAKTTSPGSDLYIWESTNNAALKVASITEISTSTNLRFSLTYQV